VEFGCELIIKIDGELRNPDGGGGGSMKLKKTTHNSIVEASLYVNECLFQKCATNFCACYGADEKILRTIMLSNIGAVTK
jgi:hypothetical protein